MTRVLHDIDRIEVTFDDPNLVANAGLLLVATLTRRLGLEGLVNKMVKLIGRAGGALPGRKVLTLVHSMIAGGTHIDHADMLRAGSTGDVLGHRVMAPSTLGTFLRAFTFGHVRQLEAVIGQALERAWGFGVGPGGKPLVIDIDSTICEVDGKAKHGAGYGYTKKLGYHPLLATRADTGEIVQARMRKGSANTQRGARRFIEELIARTRRAGATGELTVRVDSRFWSNDTIVVLKPPQSALHDGGANQHHRHRHSNRRDRHQLVGRDRLHPGWSGRGRRMRLHHRHRQTCSDPPTDCATHQVERHSPVEVVARLATPRVLDRSRW